MAIIFTAFDLAAYIYKLKWLVNNMHTHLHCQYVQTLFSIAPCSIVLGPAAFLCRPVASPETTCSMHGAYSLGASCILCCPAAGPETTCSMHDGVLM